jgi:Holliday junction DNA helicase RuvB
MINNKQQVLHRNHQEIPSLEDETLFISLRADSWNDFIGQNKTKEQIHIALQAAKKRHEPAEHMLFYGPPGLGKTTLAHIIGKELGVNVKITSGPAIERSGDLASILTNLESRDILFIDEIHRLNKVVEETLYPAMEDYALDIVVGSGPSARTLRLDLPKFTIIGATTKIGLLSNPMRDRFGVISRLTFYSPSELENIIAKAAQKLQISLHPKAKEELAKRSRGTPRIALRLLKRVRDVADVEGEGDITEAILERSLSLLDVDTLGLDDSDRRLLDVLIDKFNGGPAGIETLSAALSEDIDTIEDVLEPFLIQSGLLKRSPRGRIATEKAYYHLKKKIPKSYKDK